MLSDADLREMERLVGVRSGLPKRQARQLIDAYRELAQAYYFQNETILPDGEVGLPVYGPITLDEYIAGLPKSQQKRIRIQSAGLIAEETNRRKKNDSETV